VARPALTAISQRVRIALALPALLAIFGFGQGILDRRAWRLDLTAERRYTLSDHARRVLDALPADVRVIAFLRAQDPRNLLIEDLLRQVKARTARVRVEVVDVNRSPALARQYGIDSYGAIVVESEGRRRVFSNPSEDIFMAAMLQVTRQQKKTIGWVVGHGEGDLASSDRHTGCSTARVQLEQEYYDVRPLTLLGDDVPPEVSVVVIAGPDSDFLPEELAVLDRYLQRAGHALVMLDPLKAPELAQLLHRYGIDLRNDVVVDPGARLYGGEFLTMRIAIDRGAHPILAPLEAPPLFSLTRSVNAEAAEHDMAMAGVFLSTSNESWATTDTASLKTGAATFVAERDRQGPVPVGAEVIFRAATQPGAEPEEGHIVVYGNSKFVNNFFIEYLGNKDLFVNSVNWLARDRQTISNRPLQQALGIQQFYVSSEQGEQAFWSTAVLWPAMFGAVGLALALRRRRS
jgi:ABC-type uncharacterized transport system involved in gliding motility auxiliary subunit